MNNTSITVKVLKVKFDYDHTDPRQVYEAIKQFYPNLAAKDFTPELVQKFIPEGADPVHWARVLKKVECTLNQPKKAKPDRRSAGTNRKHNPAEAVTRRTTFDALMGVV